MPSGETKRVMKPWRDKASASWPATSLDCRASPPLIPSRATLNGEGPLWLLVQACCRYWTCEAPRRNSAEFTPDRLITIDGWAWYDITVPQTESRQPKVRTGMGHIKEVTPEAQRGRWWRATSTTTVRLHGRWRTDATWACPAACISRVVSPRSRSRTLQVLLDAVAGGHALRTSPARSALAGTWPWPPPTQNMIVWRRLRKVWLQCNTNHHSQVALPGMNRCDLACLAVCVSNHLAGCRWWTDDQRRLRLGPNAAGQDCRFRRISGHRGMLSCESGLSSWWTTALACDDLFIRCCHRGLSYVLINIWV
jgi:hypothetical protein